MLIWQVENAVVAAALVGLLLMVVRTSVLPDDWDGWLRTALLVALAATALEAALLIPRRYRFYRYTLTADTLLVERGRFWRRRRAYPLSRLLYSEIRQGPVLRVFGLFSVRAATIVETAAIGPLSRAEADRFESALREPSP